MRRFLAHLSPIFLALALLLPAALRAQVNATLVAAEKSIQPGRPFTAALRLEHKPHWHTYWLYAGTGYATTLKWELPPGWTASELQWPTPKVVKDTAGNITGQGYEDTVYLPVTLTPPADLKTGETLTLRAKAAWLMCAEACKPGKADVALTLPVSAETPATHPAHGAPISDTLKNKSPVLPTGWKLSATRAAQTITLSIAPPANAAAKFDAPWFFTANDLVAYDQPQTFTADAANKTVTLTLPRSDLGTPDMRLTGVVALGPIAVAIDLAPPAAAKSSDGEAGLSPSSNSSKAQPALPLPALLGFAFVGGLILNLMPCVFPVLGIKILGFVNQAGSDRRKVTLHGLIFTLGVLISFWILGGLMVTLWKGSGWGTQLQHPEVNFVMAGIFLLFGMSLSGAFEIGLGATQAGNVTAGKSGLLATLLEGALITIVATPCSAPFLGTALGAALTTLDAKEAMLVFTTIALGLSSPYLVLSIFPQGIKFLPRPGAWMETFKHAMAFPVYAATAAFVWILAAQVSESNLLKMVLALTAIGFSGWLYGHTNAPGAKPRKARTGIFLATALAFFVSHWAWPRADKVTWDKWSAEAVEAAKKQNRPVYLDFTARWCATCQWNKNRVFSSSEVLREFADRKVVTLKADWTNSDPAITAELAKWNRSAVPFNLLYLPGKSEPIILPELLTPQIVLNALKQK